MLCRAWESVRFASIWTHIPRLRSLSNQQSDFPDFPLKNEYPENPFFATFFDEKWPIWARSSAGRALRSHPYGPPSPARFFLPIFCPVFRTIPSKSNVLKIRFSQLFLMKNGQYGLVAQLGERCVRIAEVEGSIPFESTKNGNRRGKNHGDFSFDHRNTTDRF